MQYNSRSAIAIKRWFVKHNHCQLHHRILREVFEHAWRERCFCSPSSANLLATARAYRDRQFWEVIKDCEHQRRAAGFVHHGMGYRTEWEDVFCTVFGVHWRSLRDSCASLLEWRALRLQFSNSVCSNWGLPVIQVNNPGQLREDSIPASPATKRFRGAFSCFDNCPTAHGERPPPIEFWRPRNCFVFIVDCKPVADIVGGHVPLRADDLFPVFERLTSTMFQMISAGWTSARHIADPVIWHRRENNQIADFLANFTMETGESWLKEIEPVVCDFSPDEANFICHSDGGTRKGSCSAAAWVLEASVFKDNHRHSFPLAFRGIFFSTPVSSFTAETVALDDAVSYVSQKILNRSSGQRKRFRAS